MSRSLRAAADMGRYGPMPICDLRRVPLNSEHLRRVLTEHLTHYHEERNHQGLPGNPILRPTRPLPMTCGRIRKQERLGGLLNFYCRDAA